MVSSTVPTLTVSVSLSSKIPVSVVINELKINPLGKPVLSKVSVQNTIVLPLRGTPSLPTTDNYRFVFWRVQSGRLFVLSTQYSCTGYVSRISKPVPKDSTKLVISGI